MLVIETTGRSGAGSRRRRRGRPVESDSDPAVLPLTRVSCVRAERPFDSAEEAEQWLLTALADEERVAGLLDDGIGLLNRALHAQAAATAEPRWGELDVDRAIRARLGFGSGDQVAESRFTHAYEVDPRGDGRRATREEKLHPQARMAAVLGGREQIDACETLLLRARADLDAGRKREAALQLRVGLEALLVELRGALSDPGHEEDMAELEARRQTIGEAANAALHGDLNPELEVEVADLLARCERVLRRRRVLRG